MPIDIVQHLAGNPEIVKDSLQRANNPNRHTPSFKHRPDDYATPKQLPSNDMGSFLLDRATSSEVAPITNSGKGKKVDAAEARILKAVEHLVNVEGKETEYRAALDKVISELMIEGLTEGEICLAMFDGTEQEYAWVRSSKDCLAMLQYVEAIASTVKGSAVPRNATREDYATLRRVLNCRN